MLILWAPVGFRLTCYYYRGAYYKAFWADPPSCAVGEPRTRYRGEQSFPLILQNIHRYFLNLAVLLLVFLSHDVWKALWFADPVTGRESFGIGIGTIVLAINVTLLGSYTFGCHSLRHLVGGCSDCLSNAPAGGAGYNVRLGSQSPPHAVRVDESVLGRFLRSVRTAVLMGNLDRIGESSELHEREIRGDCQRHVSWITQHTNTMSW